MPNAFIEDDFPSPCRTPEEASVSSEQRERIWRGLRILSARQREVFVLRYVEGRSGGDVAELLGIPPGSVKQHLFRAVQNMRKALGSGV